MMNNYQNHVLTIGELAVYLKISKSSLHKLAQKGEIPGQKVGMHWRFRRDIIDLWLEGAPLHNQGRIKCPTKYSRYS